LLHKSKTPYIKDVFLAYLIDGAKRTEIDEFPIIEKWMVATELPKEIIQWDRRRDVKDPSSAAISFYCNDYTFVPILKNPKKYVGKLSQFQMVIGLDASPYDNMPIVYQKYQIYLNLAITFYLGMNGIKVIPNVRLGDDRTLSSLEAYPKGKLIAIGTNGFTRNLENRDIFSIQVIRVIDTLEPSGILVYGPASDYIFRYACLKGIPVYQYDSYTMKENAKDKAKRISGGESNEG